MHLCKFGFRNLLRIPRKIMERSRTRGRQILFKFVYGFILLSMSTHAESAMHPRTTLANETDRMSLLDLKKRVTKDPLHVMSSWNDSTHFCSWVGVTCNRSTKRVLILNLEAQNLEGSLPPSIGNVTHLTGINLRNNRFHCEIPQEVGRLLLLRHLNLSHNFFGGNVPNNISHSAQLKVLGVDFNKLIGSIPDQLSSLLSLTHLWISDNNLTGTIPSWIGNFLLCMLFLLAATNFMEAYPMSSGV